MFAMYLKPVCFSLCHLFCRCIGRHSYAALAMVGYHHPQLQDLAREALGLCINLEGFTWSDDKAEGADEREFVKYLDVLHTLPLRELIIRTFHGLSDEVWAALHAFTGLTKVSIWCMEGKPRILQGWSEKLGASLTHLELGVSSLSRVHLYDCTS